MIGPINPSIPANLQAPLNKSLRYWLSSIPSRAYGKAATELVGNRQATITSGSIAPSVKQGNKHQFNVSNGYIDIGQPPEMYSSSALTVVLSGYKNLGTDYMTFGFDTYSHLGYQWKTDGTAYFLAGATYVGVTYPTNNAWHQFAMTVDGTNSKCYVDGTLAGTIGVGSTGTAATLGGFKIGKASGSGNSTGSFVDFRVYTRVLSVGEILRLRAEQEAGYPTVFNRVQGRLPQLVASAGGPFPWYLDNSAMSGGLQTMGL